jgi:hypothetical protein
MGEKHDGPRHVAILTSVALSFIATPWSKIQTMCQKRWTSRNSGAATRTRGVERSVQPWPRSRHGVTKAMQPRTRGIMLQCTYLAASLSCAALSIALRW